MQRIKSWGYQLRNVTVDAVRASPFDLMVIDHSPVGMGGFEARFSASDVAAMKRKPDGSRRTVIAYLSIGEAESYRFYWKPAWEKTAKPAWLGDMSKDWERNYPVRYWMPEWQAIIFGSATSYLDSIINAGFDGVYLDRADVYQEWKPTNPAAEQQMASFIAKLSAYARRRKPSFLVIMQNGEELLTHTGVRWSIDAIAKEDLFYGIDHDELPNSPDNISWSLKHLKLALQAGRRVLLVEYLTDADKARAARQQAEAHGLLGYVAPRNLDSLNLGAGAAKAPGAGIKSRAATGNPRPLGQFPPNAANPR